MILAVCKYVRLKIQCIWYCFPSEDDRLHTWPCAIDHMPLTIYATDHMPLTIYATDHVPLTICHWPTSRCIVEYDWMKQGCTACGPDPAPERVISGPRSRLKSWRNFLWMMEILWKVNFLEQSTILQLITIWNSSDSINIKPQASNRLVK